MKKTLLTLLALATTVAVTLFIFRNKPCADQIDFVLEHHEASGQTPRGETAESNQTDRSESDETSEPGLAADEKVLVPSPYPIRRSKIDGSIEELLERESDGDVAASYELTARTVDCYYKRTKVDCDHPTLSRADAFIRLQLAADRGVVAAQVNYISEFGVLNQDKNVSSWSEENTRIGANYLHDAMNAGSAVAMLKLGDMGMHSRDGSGSLRVDAEDSPTGLTRTESVAYYLAATEVITSQDKRSATRKVATRFLSTLSAHEHNEAIELSRELLARDVCCFRLRRY